MRVVVILARVALVIAALVTLGFVRPAAESGWNVLTRTETESYIVTGVDPITGSESRMLGNYCSEDTILDGGTRCYASTYTVDLTDDERRREAWGRGTGVVAIALALFIAAFLIGGKPRIESGKASRPRT